MDEKSDTSKAEALISLPFFVLGVFGSWKFAEAMNVLAAKYGWNASAGAPNVDLKRIGEIELGLDNEIP